MNWHRREPTLEEILSDSITRAVMEADGVDREELEAMLSQIGGGASRRRRARRWEAWSACRTSAPG
jgi:hypothetical protein